jgi:hypothetical protein
MENNKLAKKFTAISLVAVMTMGTEASAPFTNGSNWMAVKIFTEPIRN